MKFIKNMQILRAFYRVGTCLSDIFTMSVTDNNYVWTTGQEKKLGAYLQVSYPSKAQQ